MANMYICTYTCTHQELLCLQPASGAWTLGQLYPDAVASSVLLSKAVDVVPLRLVRDVNPLFKSSELSMTLCCHFCLLNNCPGIRLAIVRAASA